MLNYFSFDDKCCLVTVVNAFIKRYFLKYTKHKFISTEIHQQVQNDMGKTNKCDIESDVQLAGCVRKYPCLYDRNLPSYKEKHDRDEAWRAIELELGLEEGTASRTFEILKKRYSRKRLTYKKLSRSRIGEIKQVSSARRSLEEYSFMSWMDDHLRFYRKSEQPMDVTGPIPVSGMLARYDDARAYSGSEEEDHFDSDSMNIRDDGSFDSSRGPTMYNRDMEERSPDPHQQRILEGGSKNNERGVELELLNNMPKIIQPPQTPRIIDKHGMDQDDIFGQMIASELRSFPDHIKFRVKHELNNVIFNFKAQEMESNRTVIAIHSNSN